jgi:hypothetical protein
LTWTQDVDRHLRAQLLEDGDSAISGGFVQQKVKWIPLTSRQPAACGRTSDLAWAASLG